MIPEITVAEVELLAYELARQLMQWGEPIPSFETRIPGVLESCLSAPFQTFNKKDLIEGLNRKAAYLYYLMIKNHPFQNGNKRVAVCTLLCFLAKNQMWLFVNNEELYKNAVWVAESKAKDKDNVINIIENFINDSIRPINSKGK